MKVQEHCDNYIGLDCSGFVSNYANATLGKSYDVMNKEANEFKFPENTRRATRHSIQPRDALAWVTTNHVAIIHSVTQGYFSTAAARRAG